MDVWGGNGLFNGSDGGCWTASADGGSWSAAGDVLGTDDAPSIQCVLHVADQDGLANASSLPSRAAFI